MSPHPAVSPRLYSMKQLLPSRNLRRPHFTSCPILPPSIPFLSKSVMPPRRRNNPEPENITDDEMPGLVDPPVNPDEDPDVQDPDLPDLPPESPPPLQQPDDVPNNEPAALGPDTALAVAQALTQLASATAALRQPVSDRGPKTMLREPDTFDGSDPQKLQPFLALLALNFRDRPSAFRTQESRVVYAISYLRGSALDWFEPDIVDSNRNNPLWLSDFSAFVHELEDNFGPFDPVGDAEEALDHIFMKENQRIMKYMVLFNKLATKVEYDDSALRRRFYDGLPDRLKDRITDVGKPRTLAGMRQLAQQLDARYWERRSEQSRSTGRHDGGSADSKSNTKSSKNNTSSSSSTTTSSKQSSNNNTSSSKSGNSKDSSASAS